jgi:DNA-binding NarL/FixJ family response regulator
MAIRVLIADDHKIVRDGLRTLLEGEREIKVVGEAADGWSAVKMASRLTPDIVIMDIGMPDLNGIEATREIIGRVSKVKVIALSMHSDKRFVVGMLKAGAVGYLLKDCAFDELNLAIQTILAGQVYLSPQITGIVVDDYLHVTSDQDTSVLSKLSSRERQVLQLLAEGKSTKEIAFDLSLSIKTIETHRQHIMNKLDLYSVAELTKVAVREGLTSLEE